MLLVPSPKFQEYKEIVPVEELLKLTDTGATPEVALAEKLAVGAPVGSGISALASFEKLLSCPASLYAVTAK